MTEKLPPLHEIIETFRREGIVPLPGILSAAQVKAVRAEGEALRARFSQVYGNTDPVKIRGGWRLDIPPVNLVRQGGAPLARETGRVLGHPLLQAACRELLGPRWNVFALVFDYREPSDDPVPMDNFRSGFPPAYFWHVDHGLPGLDDPERFSVRMQIYLNDASLANGALGYAPGTHRLVKHVRQRHKERPPPDPETMVIDTYDSLIRAAENLRATPEGLAPEYEDLLDRFMGDVPARDFAGERTALEFPAGTVLMFDDTGMHRGNMVNTGHRYVYRYLCGRQRISENVRSMAMFRNFAARQMYRLILNEPFVNLM